jgi:hypothetical protein
MKQLHRYSQIPSGFDELLAFVLLDVPQDVGQQRIGVHDYVRTTAGATRPEATFSYNSISRSVGITKSNS